MFHSSTENNLYKIINNILCKFSGINKWTVEKNPPEDLIPVSDSTALNLLQKSAHKIRIPIGVIGTATPTDLHYVTAKKIGETLSYLGFTVLCGGRSGVMKAVCEGVQINNGISIGILPNLDANEANEFVSIPIATGIGFARNSIIASSSLCLISIGGGNGTLSEIAFGLQYNKPVLSLFSEFKINGVIYLNDMNMITKHLINIIFKS